MSDQQFNSMNMKFCEFCMNIMDIQSTGNKLELVCSIPCKQFENKLKQKTLDKKLVEPILLSRRLVDNVDTQQLFNINTIYDPSLLRISKYCNNCNKNTLSVINKSYDSKMDNDLICVECKSVSKTNV